MSTPPQTHHARRPSLPIIPIPLANSVPGARPPPLTPIGYARRSSISSSLPSSNISMPFRRGSISSVSSTASVFGTDENAIVEDDDYISQHPKKEEGLSFARRMSFGARALGGVVNRGPTSPVGNTAGRGFFPDSVEPRTAGLKDHLNGQRKRGMSLGAAQAVAPTELRGVDAGLQGKKSVTPAPERRIDPFEERMVRGELYID